MSISSTANPDLQQLEALCEAFYAGNAAQQSRAHAVLLPLIETPQSLPQLQTILAHSTHLQALIFATAGLLKLFTLNWSQIADKQKHDTRQFLLNYLFQRGPDMLQNAPELLVQFVKLLCRIVKYQWLEDIANQNIVEQVDQFLQSGTSQWVIGLHIYTELTQDMQPSIGPKMSRNRRTAISFKDTALSDIFKVAIRTLQQFHNGTMHIPDRQEETKLLKGVLQLTVNCLGFDFLGTIPDETSLEQSTVMVPQAWTILHDQSISKIFLDLYEMCWSDTRGPRIACARLCLECLVLMAALRRSFFTDENRSTLLRHLIQGTSNIIKGRIGLNDDDCFHALCRLLGRINTANQLSELCSTEAFMEWASQVFNFTIQSIRDWKHLQNSKHYLLGVWSHMVGPLGFLKDPLRKALEQYISDVTIFFVTTRMELAEAVAVSDGDCDFENPLVNEIFLTEQLDLLTILGRCRYPFICEHVLKLFDETQAKMKAGQLSENVVRDKLTWLVYIVGALVGGHANVKSSLGHFDAPDELTLLNNKLASVVFNLIETTNKFADTSESMELSYLYFLEQYRKLLSMEHARQIANGDIPINVSNYSGSFKGNMSGMMDLLVKKIGFNLQARSNMEAVIKRSLNLFHELATGVNVVLGISQRSSQLIPFGKYIVANETVHYIMANHSDPCFSFLSVRGYGKYRTTYYFTLAKLLFLDIRDDKAAFERFMNPLSVLFAQLWEQAMGGAALQNLRNPECKIPIINLVRDLRGICMACNSADPYSLFFNWLVDKPKVAGQSKIHFFTWAVEVWWDDAEVCVPVIKLLTEFVHNKAQRITFDQSSASGILLFKEVSAITVAYGERILSKTDFTDIYSQKYKGLAVTLEMLSHALSGQYVNFGVFEVYGDGALASSLSIALRMCLAIPSEELQAYLKSLKPVYAFLDLATKNFMPQVLNLQPCLLATLLRAVEDGLCSFETAVASQCFSTVDSVVTFFYENRNSQESQGEQVRNFMQSEPTALIHIFRLSFQFVISGECPSAWIVSRPLLGLILLLEDEFCNIKNQLINQQADQKKKDLLNKYFYDLMDGISENLNSENKDSFSRNVYQFTQVVRSLLG